MKSSKNVLLGCLLLFYAFALSVSADYAAVGDYVQDTVITENPSDLYNASKGLHFDGMDTYEKGDFSSYTWSGNDVIKTEAGLLMEGSYENVHSLVCYPNISSLVNPAHNMYEQISINSSMISYYEPGAPSNCSDTLRMAIERPAVSYKVYTGYIPMKRISKDSEETGCVGQDCYIDFEYRGKMLFLGEEYYVKDIDGNDKIYLAKGQILNVSDSGYTAQYKGYKFKIAHIITSSPYYCPSMLLDVQKPDGTVVEVQVSGFANGLVDNLEISGLTFQIGTTQSGSIIVYDLATQILLQDGEDLEMGGHYWRDWEVSFNLVDTCDDGYFVSDGTLNDCSHVEYGSMDPDMQEAFLKSITLVYSDDLEGAEALGVNESLIFPNAFRLRFRGYLNDKFRDVSCPVQGNVYASYFIGTMESGWQTTTSTTTTTTTSSTTTTQACTSPSYYGSVGEYVQDSYITEPYSDLYDANKGLHYDGGMKTYEKGDFTSYTWCGQIMTQSEAGLLMEGSYENVHSLFGYESIYYLRNPVHDMDEEITINSSMLHYYEPGTPSNCSTSLRLAIPPGAISYSIYTDYIPMKTILKDAETGCEEQDCYIDFEYRGKMIFSGEEYYVKDIDAGKIYLDKGSVIDISNSGFEGEYGDYSFKVDHFIYSGGNNVTAIAIDVRKPDGTIVQVQVSSMANGVVDNLEIAGVFWQQGGTWKQASLIVYDLSNQIILEDGEDLVVGGQVKTGWKVEFVTIDNCIWSDQASDGSWNDCSLSEYDDMDQSMTESLLKSIVIKYDHDLVEGRALGVNGSLVFPNSFKLKFRGYLSANYRQVFCSASDVVYSTYFIGTVDETNLSSASSATTTSTTSTTLSTCTLPGDSPPCGEISLGEVISYINLWASGSASLSEVINLINAWASGA